MADTRELLVPACGSSFRVRIHDPGAMTPSPALIYLHGGGWTLFSIDTHDRLMREYAARTGVRVAGVDYSLSPEARFPVALEQVLAAVRWLSTNGDSLGIDARRLAIGGDSAGANLALSSCIALRDADEHRDIRALLLNYGAFARHSSDAAIEKYGGDGYMLAAGEMDEFWRNYLRDETDARNPFACPILSDLTGLPPVFLAIPECDLLAEQSIALAGSLEAAGVEFEAALYKGASHSFLEAVSISALSDRALTEASNWLHAALTAA